MGGLHTRSCDSGKAGSSWPPRHRTTRARSITGRRARPRASGLRSPGSSTGCLSTWTMSIVTSLARRARARPCSPISRTTRSGGYTGPRTSKGIGGCFSNLIRDFTRWPGRELAFRAVCSKEIRDGRMAFRLGVVQGRVTAVSDRVDVGTVVQEHADDVEIAVHRGLVERRVIRLAPHVRVRARREQDPYDVRVVARHRRVDRRVREPTPWFVVHVGAVLQEDLDRLGMTEERREAERVEAF